MTDAEYEFPGTTVDSTSTFEFQVVNDLGAPQTIFFSALDAPFSLLDNSPLEIPANDSASVTLQFQPSEVGEFSGTLEAVGSVFGSASFDFSGNGIQVLLDWTPESLTFDTTAIGGSSYLDVVISNVGDGMAEVTVQDSPSGLFVADFVEGSQAVLEPCNNVEGSDYFTYTLHVNLGSDPGNTYWYIYDEYGVNYYGGSYNNPADGMELCLPHDFSQDVETYIEFFNYGSGQDATLELRDGFGNTIQLITLSQSSQYFGSWVMLDIGEAPLVYSSLGDEVLIAEGEEGTLRVNFNPLDAGEVSDIVTVTTNSPVNPTIDINCNGVGISELSGDVCDLVMTAANSPYIFSDDVVIPVGCDLTIEAGVEVLLGEHTLLVEGGIEILGSGTNPVVFDGGDLRIDEGEAAYISHLQVISTDLNTPYELAYYNDFATSSDGYEFDCECPATNYFGSGSSQSNSSDGCYYFFRSDNSSYVGNEDNHSLRFRSDNHDGYVFPDEFPTALAGGKYAISFGYDVSYMERDCQVKLELLQGDDWITVWESRPDQYTGDTWHLAYAEQTFSAGEQISFRIKNDIASGNSDYDLIEIFIDEVRVERVREEIDIDTWDFSNNDEWLQWEDDNEGQIFVSGDTVSFRNYNQDIDIYTDTWAYPPLEAQSSGWYILEFENQVLEHEYGQANYIRFKPSSSGSWYYVQSNNTQYGNSYDGYQWDWRHDRVYLPMWLNAGERLDFHFYVSGSSSYHMDVDFANFKLFRWGEDIGDFTAFLESQRSLHLTALSLESCRIFDSELNSIESEFGTLRLLSSNLTDTYSTINSIKGSGDCAIQLEGTVIEGSADNGVSLTGNSINFSAEFSTIINCQGSGISLNAADGDFHMNNCIIADNAGHGIQSSIKAHLSYVTIANNGLNGWNRGISSGDVAYDQYGNCVTDMDNDGICDELDPIVATWSTEFQDWVCVNDENGNGICDENEGGLSAEPSVINNCIIANNDFNSGSDIIEPSAFIQYTYTDPYPYFVEGSYMLEPYSPCVDAAMPWHNDQNMPYGIGGLRADMGAYGGPDNAGWGGNPAPSGSAALQSVADTPQDQGYNVGLTFDASAFDNSIVSDNISHYAIWRHFDPTGEPIASLSEGNWELLGTMPAQGFSGYAYQAEALGNSNTFGDFSSCYTVVAHTDDEDVYWYSNVSCGESVDNLAPDDPDLNGLVLETGEAQISWTPPTEEDYAYTEIYNDDGFTAEVGNDTIVLDPSVIPGYTYTYTAVNYDVNGNASDASSLTLEIPAGLDIIPLTAGWNLISTDRSASTPAIEDVLSSLDEGNVEYVTGFNNGVVLYDPDGFFLFNTLDEFESGYGYWIKVQEDDTLEIAGSLLTDGYMPSLNMGWNLIGYPNAESSSIETYFVQLLSDESLEYVTGFNQGSSYFDPNGLPFLNSLVELENGFGYWLKVSQAYDFNGLVTDQVDEPLAALSGASGVTQPNPNYMLLNGTSNLAQEAGKQVLVHALDGTVVGALPILEGGYLMTTALYGDDPATEALEGLQSGDEVYFSFEGKHSKETVVYSGQMELRHINLEFEVQSLFEVFPNPFAEAITISGVLEVGGMLDAVITDSQGRVVAQFPAIEMTAGSYSLDWQLPRLAPGYYNCTLRVDGVTLESIPIMHVEQ